MKNQLRAVLSVVLLCCASAAYAGGGPDSYRSVVPLAEKLAKAPPKTIPCDYCGAKCLPAQRPCCSSEDNSFRTTTPLWEMFAKSPQPQFPCGYCGAKCLPAQPTCCSSEDNSFKTTTPLREMYRHHKRAMPFFGCQSCPDCQSNCGHSACGCAK